mmetsp:Transcript_26287/g.38971  ORF Transcript_26287/g.38971 Transcript_26287/m.38971 type:complete len:129 (+) Transcript_26287:1092-1478(+)
MYILFDPSEIYISSAVNHPNGYIQVLSTDDTHKPFTSWISEAAIEGDRSYCWLRDRTMEDSYGLASSDSEANALYMYLSDNVYDLEQFMQLQRRMSIYQAYRQDRDVLWERKQRCSSYIFAFFGVHVN